MQVLKQLNDSYAAVSRTSCLMLLKHTQRIHDRLLRRVRIVGVGLYMNMSIDMRRNFQCQLDHLYAHTFVSLHAHWLSSPAFGHCTAISTASSSTPTSPNLDERFCASDRDSRINAAFDGLDSSPAAIAYLKLDLDYLFCMLICTMLLWSIYLVRRAVFKRSIGLGD